MRRWLIFPAAGLALAVSNGVFAQPAAAWIGPALMVRLVRGARGRGELFLAWLAFLAAWLIGWAGVFRVAPAELAPMALALSGLGFLPYLLDRLAVRRLAMLPASLVLPSANVAVEAGLGLLSPFGAWGALGYSQVEWLPLAQLATLTGLHGLSFLPFWFAALLNSAWERKDGRSWRLPIAAFAAILMLVLGFGMLRLAIPSGAASLPAAMVIPSVQDNLNYDERLAPRIAAEMLAASDRAASAGARLVAWPEDSLFVRGAGERVLLSRAADLAARRRFHFAIAYGLRTEPGGLAYRNRLVLIGPDGHVVWRYDKAHPVPGYEERHMQPGTAPIARAPTPFGILAGAICFDGDHDPVLTGARGSRLLLLPSDDWPAIATLHARMARLRALEIGVPLLRPTINGIAVASDARGRLQAWKDSRAPESRIVALDLPLNAASTFRAAHPLWFPAGSAVLLLALLLAAALSRRAGSQASDLPTAASSPSASPGSPETLASAK